MPSYILRDVDPQLWQKLKVKAAREGEAIRAVILRLIKEYVRNGGAK